MIGSNFVPIEKNPISIGVLDTSQIYLSDCQKMFRSIMHLMHLCGQKQMWTQHNEAPFRTKTLYKF